jgi:hypothetical protein
LLKASWTLSTSAFNAFSACRLVSSASFAIRVIRSALFIAASLSSQKCRPKLRCAFAQRSARQGSTHGMLHDACGYLSQDSICGVPRVLRNIYAGQMEDCQPFFHVRMRARACGSSIDRTIVQTFPIIAPGLRDVQWWKTPLARAISQHRNTCREGISPEGDAKVETANRPGSCADHDATDGQLHHLSGAGWLRN